MANQCTGAELVVKCLEAHGVTHIFGIPGAKIDGVFNALVDIPIDYSDNRALFEVICTDLGADDRGAMRGKWPNPT